MVYDYKCDECGKVSEIRHGMNDTPVVNCDVCKNKMRRIFTGGSGTIFKGRGWSSNGTATAPPVRKITEKRIGVKPGYNPSPSQIEKDFGGKVVKKVDKRFNFQKKRRPNG